MPVRFQQFSSETCQTTMLQYGMTEGTAQGLADMTVAQNDGIYDHETRTPSFTIPTISFPQWGEQVLKPSLLAYEAPSRSGLGAQGGGLARGWRRVSAVAFLPL